MNREQRAAYWALSAQDKVLYVVDRSDGGSRVGFNTSPSHNTVSASSAKALVAKGVLEYTTLNEYVRRVQA